MKQGKRFLSALLACCLLVGLMPAAMAARVSAPSGFENFTPGREYTEQFTDIVPSDWYYTSVVSAYEMGLMSGQSGINFAPKSNISVAEVLTLTSLMLSTYLDDGHSFEGGSPWYQPYVDYALEWGLIQNGQFSDYGAPAKRAEMAQIFAALPEEMLAPINDIPTGAIPDVALDQPYQEAVYTLYEAGIVSGNDAEGTFLPSNPITRGEVACILANLVNPAQRKNLTLTVTPVTLYADTGASIQVLKSDMHKFLSVGWRTAPFTISPDAGAEAILNAATLLPMKTGDEQLDNTVDNILAQIITPGMTTYDKVKACYDYLMANTSYDTSREPMTIYLNQCPYISVQDYVNTLLANKLFQTGTGVCDHYAAAFMIMTRRLGLNSYTVTGMHASQRGGLGGHAWNVISVCGTDYVFDAQIDDYNGGKYRRFCKTFQELEGKYHEYDIAASKAEFSAFTTWYD